MSGEFRSLEKVSRLVWIELWFLGWRSRWVGWSASRQWGHQILSLGPWHFLSFPVASLGRGKRTKTLQPRVYRRVPLPRLCRHTPSIASPDSTTKLPEPPASSLLSEWASNHPAQKCISTTSHTKPYTTLQSQIWFSKISHKEGIRVTPTKG